MATFVLSGRSHAARQKLQRMQVSAVVAISAISEAEILFGIEKKPEALRLRSAAKDLLGAVQILPWDSVVARAYSKLRARLNATGKSLSALDTLIASHAVARDGVLVTHDRAFLQTVPFVQVEDWATDLESL